MCVCGGVSWFLHPRRPDDRNRLLRRSAERSEAVWTLAEERRRATVRGVWGRKGEGWEPKAAVISFFLLLIGFFAVYAAFMDRTAGKESVASAVVGVIMLGLGAALGVTAAVSNYRRTMRRPWPKVPPVEEDQEEW